MNKFDSLLFNQQAHESVYKGNLTPCCVSLFQQDATVIKTNPVGLEGNGKIVLDGPVSAELGGGEKTPIRTQAEVLPCQPCFSIHRRG